MTQSPPRVPGHPALPQMTPTLALDDLVLFLSPRPTGGSASGFFTLPSPATISAYCLSQSPHRYVLPSGTYHFLLILDGKLSPWPLLPNGVQSILPDPGGDIGSPVGVHGS